MQSLPSHQPEHAQHVGAVTSPVLLLMTAAWSCVLDAAEQVLDPGLGWSLFSSA